MNVKPRSAPVVNCDDKVAANSGATAREGADKFRLRDLMPFTESADGCLLLVLSAILQMYMYGLQYRIS
jgi:hypothetical protein